MEERADPWRATLKGLWGKQAQWSRLATQLKASHRSWNGPLIIVGFIGVVASTLTPYLVGLTAAKPQESSLLAFSLTIVGPLLVTSAAVLTREILGPKAERKWIKARMVSEALKAEGFIFAAGAPPYGVVDAPELLAKKIDEIAVTNDDLGPLPEVDAPAGDRPQDPLDVEPYIAARVDEQRKHHAAGARLNARKLSAWRGRSIVLMVVSAGLGIIAGVTKQAALNTWIAVVSTALATVTAYATASRFESLAATYAATAERLEGLVRQWRAKAKRGPEERDRFILDCEAVLASQNRSWSDELSTRLNAKLTATDPPPPVKLGP